MSVIRPNGKPYVARKPIEVQEFCTAYGDTGLFILRTHDEAEARQAFYATLNSYDLGEITPTKTWVRHVPWDAGYGYDTTWITDVVRGVPALEWNPS